MGELINGRTPEEIKKGLKCCFTPYSCYGECPYDNSESDICDCTSDLSKDALAYIKHLEAKQPKWISVKDSKKPRHGQECFCVCTMPNDPKHEWDYLMVLKWYAYGSNGLVDRPHFQHEGYEGMTVSHWMPTHKLPKEDE